MPLPYVSIWHLLIIPALFLIYTQPAKRPFFAAAVITTVPLLLLVPILSQTFFGLFSLSESLLFLAGQGLALAAAAVLASFIYEQGVKPKIVRTESSRRHSHLIFLVGLGLALLLFDLLNQPLIIGLIVGMAFNLLIAIRYYADQLNEVLFATIFMGLFHLLLYTLILFDLPGEASRFWFEGHLSGAVIFGIAAEKALVVTLFGAFWGPVYIAVKDVLAKR